EGYSHAREYYAAVADTRLQPLQVALATAAIEGAVALPFAVAGAVVLAIAPLLKTGYGYHVAVSAIGLCGLASLAWRRLSSQPRRITHAIAGVVLVVSVPLALVQVYKLNVGLAERIAILRAIGARDWPAQAIPQSNYLLLADTIRKAAPGARTLGVS